MADIYDQHRAAFAQTAAWIILDASGDRVATVAIKFPRDGAGRLYAYVHWIGVEMVRGWASGGGYDKTTAAVSSAAKHIRLIDSDGRALDRRPDSMEHKFITTLISAETEWSRWLERAGFTVLQAV